VAEAGSLSEAPPVRRNLYIARRLYTLHIAVLQPVHAIYTSRPAQPVHGRGWYYPMACDPFAKAERGSTTKLKSQMTKLLILILILKIVAVVVVGIACGVMILTFIFEVGATQKSRQTFRPSQRA
jgi:hypothetical protein